MKQNDNLVKLAKITNTAASFLIFLAGLMLIFLASTEVTSLQRTVLAVLFLLTGAAKMIGYYSNDLYRLAFQFDFCHRASCAPCWQGFWPSCRSAFCRHFRCC